jgi:hypothetical protein
MDFAIQSADVTTIAVSTELVFIEDSSLELVGGGTITNTL